MAAHDQAPNSEAAAESGRAPVVYPPHAVLTAEQVAAMLQVSMSTFERLDIPCSYLQGRSTGSVKRRNMRRYIAGDVLEELRRRAA